MEWEIGMGRGTGMENGTGMGNRNGSDTLLSGGCNNYWTAVVCRTEAD